MCTFAQETDGNMIQEKSEDGTGISCFWIWHGGDRQVELPVIAGSGGSEVSLT